MYYPCSENKGADQLRGYREADLHLCFRIGKNPVFSRCGSDVFTFIITFLQIHVLNFEVHFIKITTNAKLNIKTKCYEPRHEKTRVRRCENKGADQLHSNCKADHAFVFCYTDSTISLLPVSEISSF